MALEFSPDGRRLAASSDGVPVTLIDPLSGVTLARVEGTGAFPYEGGCDLTFLSSSQIAIASLEREIIRLFDFATGQFGKTFQGHNGPIRGIAAGAGGQSLISGSLDGTLGVWRLDERDGPHVVDARSAQITRVAYSPDGRWLATTANDGRVKLMDARSGGATIELRGNGLPITGLEFSLDGKLLACGTEWFTYPTGLSVWDLATREPRFTLAPDTQMGEKRSRSGGPVAVHPDGRTLACAGGCAGVRSAFLKSNPARCATNSTPGGARCGASLTVPTGDCSPRAIATISLHSTTRRAASSSARWTVVKAWLSVYRSAPTAVYWPTRAARRASSSGAWPAAG